MTYIGLFILGLIAYTFIEYAVHRWLLHGPMVESHRLHHRNPNLNLRTPAIVIIPASILAALTVGLSFTVGLLACWVGSAVLHRRIHTGRLTNRWVKACHRHHVIHHRKAYSNFGVTTTVWDRLFGTHRK